MICPRCGNEWDASRSPCTRCGLVIRLPNQPGASGRSPSITTPQKGTSQPLGNLPQSGQWSRDVSASQLPKQQSGVWQPFTGPSGSSLDSQRAANPLSSGGSSSNNGQSFPPSSSRAMPSSSNVFPTHTQATQSPASPFARGRQPGNTGSVWPSADVQPEQPLQPLQPLTSPFSQGIQPGGSNPMTPPPSSSGPLSRGLRSNGEFPSFSSPTASSSPQRNAIPGGNKPQASAHRAASANGQSQEQEYQRPFLFSAPPVPETPQPFASFGSALPKDDQQLNTPLSGTDRNAEQMQQMQMQQKLSRAESLTSRSVPQRPQLSASRATTDPLKTDIQRQQALQSSIWASRLVTESPLRNGQLNRSMQTQSQQKSAAFPPTSSIPSQMHAQSAKIEVHPLEPGTLLRSGRYRLYEMEGRQEWLSGVYEARWIAQDAQRGGSQVILSELVLPENFSVMMQSTLRSATMALSQVGRHPHIPTLWDAFSDKGRNFFAFEPFDGESLLSRMRRTGRAMSEQDVIECCLQMTEVLELLAQQSPPLVHGLISPEHILVARNGSQYALINFSLVLAGGATQFVSGIDRTQLSPYTAPEFMRGVVDVRSDLYALMATAYHTVTGSVPAGVSGSIPSAQRLNPNVSSEFDAILTKGLRPVVGQRYQRPSELRQDLLAMRSVSGSLVSGSGQRSPATAPTTSRPLQTQSPSNAPAADAATQDAFKPVAQALQSIIPFDDDEDQGQLLPRPEALPPMPQGNTSLATALWLTTIILGIIIFIAINHGF